MRERLVLIFMIDALGFEQAAGERFLPSLVRPRRPVRSVLGYSSAAIPTIMSGLRPQEHGHLSMYRRDRGDGVFRPLAPWLRLATRLTRRRYRLQKLVQAWLRRRGISGYYSLYDVPLELLPEFDLCQRRSLYAPGGFEGGAEGLADLMAGSDQARLWGWDIDEESAFTQLQAEIEGGRRRVLFLYTAELDALMHATGPGSAATAERLARYSERITRLVELARRQYREVRIFVFGDHGMAPVVATHDLWGALEESGLRCPQDLLWFFDSTMARFWPRDAATGARLTEALAALDYGRVLTDDELERLGARFPGGDYGEIIFLLQEGRILVPSFMSATPVRGMHGYHPQDRHSHTTLLTNVEGREYPGDLVALHTLLRSEIAEALAG